MKVLKTVVKVIAIVATVASFIPGPWQPVAALVAKIAWVASAALEVAAPTRKARPSARGSPTEYRLDPNSGIPYMVGRTQFAGCCVKRETWGEDNVYQGFTSVYSCGPINGIEAFTADRNVIGFDGAGAAIGTLAGFMWFVSQLGACPSPLLASPVAGYPGWDASRKMSGLAASHWVLQFDKDGKKFTGGPPVPGIIATGVKVYDPRLDSTYPGGSGACRALDESTYVYSETPHLHALTYALGRWQNGKKRMGIGFPVDSIDLAYFVNAANVDEANGWKVGGVVYSTDSKWNTLKWFMEAGGARPLTVGGKLSGSQSAPKAAVVTITDDEIVGKGSIAATTTFRDRINTGIPRYRSEAHGWEFVQADPVSIAGYIATDGGVKTREYEWTLVQQTKQASQLTAYEIYNAREMGPIELPLKIRWIGLKPGDAVTLSMPKINLIDQKAIVNARSFDVQTGSVTIKAWSETEEKHNDALTLNGAAPPIPSLGFDPNAEPVGPLITDFTVFPGQLDTAVGTIPAIKITGSIGTRRNVTEIEFQYRKVGTLAWKSAGWFSPDTTEVIVTGVEPGETYEARMRYKIQRRRSSFVMVGGTATVEVVGADSANSSASIIGQGPWATLQRDVDSVLDEVDAIASDGLLTRAEKRSLLKQMAVVTSDYNSLLALANANDVDVSEVTDAYNALIAGLETYSPGWNDDTSNTRIYTPLMVGVTNYLSGWNLVSGATIGAQVGGYTPLTDPNGAGYAAVTRSGNVLPNGHSTIGLIVKKDAVPRAVRMPMFQIFSGAGFDVGLFLDTQTGDVGTRIVSGGFVDYGVFDLGEDWLLWGTVNTIGATVDINVYPAIGSNFVIAPTATGSISVRGIPLLAAGDFDALGGAAIQARLGALGKAIADVNLVDWSGVLDAPYASIYSNNMLVLDTWKPGMAYNPGLPGYQFDPTLNSYTIFGAGAGVNHNTIYGNFAGPSGASEPVLWASGGGTYGDGGIGSWIIGPGQGFDPALSYRASVWVYGQTPANGYFGPAGPDIRNMDGSPNGNPYWVSAWIPPVNLKWYLLVGILHGANYGGGDSGVSGMYDPDTGKKVLSGVDFKLGAGAASAGLRFFYYDNRLTNFGYFARPRIEPLAENTPSVEALMATVGADINKNVFDSFSGTIRTRAELLTALGSSAGFSGQGSLATLNYVTFGGTVYETTGIVATLVAFKTALGISSAISGQGLLATMNNVNLDTYVLDGTTYARIKGSELTSGVIKLGIPGSGYRLGDARNIPPIVTVNLRYKYTGTVTYTCTTTSATITVGAGSLIIGSTSVSFNAMTVNVSGTAGTTRSVYLYCNVNAYISGAHTLLQTTDANTIYSNDNNVFLGTVDVVFPASGSGGGTGGPGGGGITYCVAEDVYVETRHGSLLASDVQAGELGVVITEDGQSLEWAKVLSNVRSPNKEEMCQLMSVKSGISVRVSRSTPVTLEDGTAMKAGDVDGQCLPVVRRGELTWEPCVADPLPPAFVRYISFGGRSFLAGDTPAEGIITHNYSKP
jgi:hypothetical protein